LSARYFTSKSSRSSVPAQNPADTLDGIAYRCVPSPLIWIDDDPLAVPPLRPTLCRPSAMVW